MDQLSLAVMAGLGAYHGLNPAMGWLFAVGLGLQEKRRGAVVRALPAIAIGHEASIVLVAGVVLGLGVITDPSVLRIGAGIALITFGIFRFVKPRAHPRWTTMRVNDRELGLWSFLMSSAHGAGLMVAPVLLGAGAAANASEHDHVEEMGVGSLSVPDVALALTVHVGAMLLVMGAVALIVYDRLGVKVLRRAWLNTEWLWAGAFVMAGAITLVT